ncbi:GNAT family N-acetyltransferase [Zhouia sp. PK063]
MKPDFKIIPKKDILIVAPLIQKLSNHSVAASILKERLHEMTEQNYECIGIYDEGTLIGCCGIWFMTRHYAGKSCEADHVYIDDTYRSKGIGKQLFEWLEAYVKTKGCEAIELNAYIHNEAGHRFYEREGFAKPGYHFLKRF